MTDLVRRLDEALQAAGSTPRGKRALQGHDEDFQIEVAGHEPVHVEISDGELSVNGGSSPRREPLRFTRVQLDEDTLDDILGGRVSPVEAMEEGRLFLRTRVYGGALITVLLRAVYDQAREQLLSERL